jgi:hypothetical protein
MSAWENHVNPIDSKFVDTMTSEGAERWIRQALSKMLKQGADTNDSAQSMVRGGLKELFSSRGKLMGMATGVPGFTYSLLGTAIATVLQRPGFWQTILPKDDRASVRSAKFLLRTLSSSFAIGAGEAFGDAVDRLVDDNVSSPRTAEADRTLPLDQLVEHDLLPGRVFTFERHDDGRPKTDTDGLAVVGDPAWRSAISAAKAAFQTSSGHQGRGQQGLTFQDFIVSGQRFISLQTAADRVAGSGTASQADLDAIRQAVNATRSSSSTDAGTYVGVSPEAMDVIVALSASFGEMGQIDYEIAEDLLKDLFRTDGTRVDASQVNQLARFREHIQIDPFTQVPHFTPELAQAILKFIDTGLRGEISPLKRGIRMVNRLRLQNRVMGLRAGWNWAWAYLRWPIFLVYGNIFLFLLFFACAGIGSFWGGTDLSDVLIATTLIVFGGWGMLIELFLLKPVQGVINPLIAFISPERDWLVSFGKKFSGLVGVYGFLIVLVKAYTLGPAIAMLSVQLLLAAAMGMVGALMTLDLIGWNATVKMTVGRGMRWAIKLVSATLISVIVMALGIGLMGFGVNPYDVIAQAWNGLWELFRQNPWVASIVLGAIYTVAVYVLWNATRKSRSYVYAGQRYVDEMGFGLKTAVALLGIAIVLVPWMPYDKWPQSAVVAQEQVSTETPDPATASTVIAPVHSVPPGAHKGVSEHIRPSISKPLTPCEKIPFHLRSSVKRCRN